MKDELISKQLTDILNESKLLSKLYVVRFEMDKHGCKIVASFLPPVEEDKK